MTTLKYSRQREAIKEFLQGREDHPSADLIYQEMRKQFPNISLGTVYRNLSLLSELGEIRRITSDGSDRYDARMMDHSHFICKNCGAVIDVIREFHVLAKDMDKNWENGQSDDCQVLFFGICKKCRKEKNSQLTSC